MRNFMSHDETAISFPGNGIISVTGPNGAGKSAIIEAITMGLWGKSLRKQFTPWRKEQHGRVYIELGDLEITRTWTGKSKRLEWRHAGEEFVKFETPTKAQEILNSYIGEFDVWRKTSVFSSSDASLFTLATDSERKKLLESLLGLAWFDDALKLCRIDLNATKRSLSRLEGEMEQLRLASSIAKDSEKAAKEFLDTMEKPENADKLNEQYDQLEKELEEYDEKLNASKNKMRDMQTKLRDSEREVKSLRQKIEEMGDKCFSCGQKISATIKKRMNADLNRAIEEDLNLKDELAEEMEELEVKVRSLMVVNEDASDNLNEIKGKIRDIRVFESQYEKSTKTLENAKAKVSEIFDKCFDLEDKINDKQVEIAELEDCDKILGLRGVRAQILGNVLGSIESITNSWLSKISDNKLEIQLKEYSESKNGNISDAISLEVTGAGDDGGYYTGTSGGERRRIDIAILFALAEISAGSKNKSNIEFLFFDEVLDSLDDEGVHIVINSLKEISEETQVVVVSHAHVEQLYDICDLALKVENGKVLNNE